MVQHQGLAQRMRQGLAPARELLARLLVDALQRPASPNNSVRCKFFTQRGSVEACQAPSTRPSAGST